MTIGHHDLPDVFGNAAGAAGIDGGIELEKFHLFRYKSKI
jgi:hypothetical protein